MAKSARLLLGWIAGIALACGGHWAPRSVGATTQNSSNGTVRDGVYDDTQAERGKGQYLKECSSCHLADLGGSDQAVPLKGEAFILQWENRTVSDLFKSISATMPQGTPGQLSSQTYIDIVAFLLQANEFPAGSIALPRNAEGLDGIRIVRRKP
jgi:mono/diheme cytochrome c family protein